MNKSRLFEIGSVCRPCAHALFDNVCTHYSLGTVIIVTLVSCNNFRQKIWKSHRSIANAIMPKVLGAAKNEHIRIAAFVDADDDVIRFINPMWVYWDSMGANKKLGLTLLKMIPRCNSTHESPWKDYYSRGRVRQSLSEWIHRRKGSLLRRFWCQRPSQELRRNLSNIYI